MQGMFKNGDVRRRILREKHFRLVPSAATAPATILEITLRLFWLSSFPALR